jgi:isoleucyl-tRNA synthetase
LEEVRVAGKIGSSLAAEVELQASGETYEYLRSFNDDLRFVFITSGGVINGNHQVGNDITVAFNQACMKNAGLLALPRRRRM